MNKALLFMFSFVQVSYGIIDLSKICLYDVVIPLLPENPAILEAGAYDGIDSVKLAHFWPSAKIYSFEPVPELYSKMMTQTKACTNIYCFPFALGKKTGWEKFFLSINLEDASLYGPSGSLLPPKEHLNWSPTEFRGTVNVPTLTIDEWAEMYAIPRIDLMWLDMQGMELDALRASPNILSKVSIIYTEVEFVEAYAEQGLYQDILSFLEQNGFVEYGRNFESPFNGGYGWYGDALFVRKECLEGHACLN
jgi:FkbM family methyltransferase